MVSYLRFFAPKFISFGYVIKFLVSNYSNIGSAVFTYKSKDDLRSLNAWLDWYIWESFDNLCAELVGKFLESRVACFIKFEFLWWNKI